MAHLDLEHGDTADRHPPRATLLRRILAAAARSLSQSIVPPLCLDCQTPLATSDALCAPCWSRIDFIRPPLCDRLGLPLPFDPGGGGPQLSAAAMANPPLYDRARAVARYDGAMRDLVHALKFHDRHELRRLLGQLLVTAGAPLIAESEVLVPVPLARLRLLQRRFNQAALLAREIAGRTGLAFEPQALVRTRRTPSQVGLTHDQRRRNVAGAFAVPPRARALVEGRAILLVDDVITTGATVDACAKALKSAGAARVDVLALALVSDPMAG